MIKKKCFITNDLLGIDLSPYAHALEVWGKSLVEIKSVSFKRPLPDYDWVFFYSKNGVKYFIDQLNEWELSQFQTAHIGTIGFQTAAYLNENYGLTADYVYDSKNDALLKQTLNGAQVLFPQGIHSRKTVEKLLSKDNCLPIVVYDNAPALHYTIEQTPQIVIVTSPMNADAVIFNSILSANTIVVTLGTTTSKHLMDVYGVASCYPDEPSIDAALELVVTEFLG